MAYAKIGLKIYQREITPELSKGVWWGRGNHSCMRHAVLTSYILLSSFIMTFQSLT